MASHSRPSKHHGFTLIELLVATTLLIIVTGAAYSVVTRGGKTAGAGMVAATTGESARLVLERVSREMLGASFASFDPPTPSGAQSLSFQVVGGISSGTPTPGNTRAIMLVDEESDPADGVDNDADGLTDEKDLVYVRSVGLANEQRIIWARGVPALAPGEQANGVDDNGNGLIDEPGFSMTLSGRSMTLRLALERRSGPENTQSREFETTVSIRN